MPGERGVLGLSRDRGVARPCTRCAAGGMHLRLTADAGMRLVVEHRAH